MIIFAECALTFEGWKQNVAVEVGKDGKIAAVTPHASADDANIQVSCLLPAPVNVHSHAFQRAMAGLTEQRGPAGSDSFWTWRKLMFRFLDQLRPEHVEAITALVQMEMLEAGYATNVEFHYLHHQPGGVPYDDAAELSYRIVEASRKSGIGLTLLPVHYEFGGCDGRPLGDGQIRFGNNLDSFANIWERAVEAVGSLPADATSGVAPHSLRAIGPDALPKLAGLAANRPIHMHLAEQVAEVEEVQAHWGQRPVEWLLDHADPDNRWCLIHCTQMQPHETRALADSGAVAGLCPITESSLGDGIFDGVNWLAQNGQIAIGSDSNIRISLSEELRTLEYSQRLRDRSRAALATTEKSTGRRIYDAIASGGAKAAGRNTGSIEPGMWADLLSLDTGHPDFMNRTGDLILDGFLFSHDDRMVSNVWSAGRHLVHDGQHINRQSIMANYAKTMADLVADL